MSAHPVVTQPVRVLQIRRLVNILCVGLASSVVGALLMIVGWCTIQWSSSSGAAAGGVMACIAALVLLSVGTGAVVTSGIALSTVRRFSLRSLFVLVAVCGLLTAIWVGLARPWWQKHVVVETPAVQNASTTTRMMPTHTGADLRIVTDKVMVTLPGYLLFFVAALGILPLASLPLVFRRPKHVPAKKEGSAATRRGRQRHT